MMLTLKQVCWGGALIVQRVINLAGNNRKTKEDIPKNPWIRQASRISRLKSKSCSKFSFSLSMFIKDTHRDRRVDISITFNMVEKVESLYDATSSTTPLVNADYLTEGNEPFVSATNVPENCQYVEIDAKPKATTSNSEDKENIQFAGIGSAVLGLIVGGPILAAVFGFGAVYAAERNTDVRNKFGEIWTNMKKIDKRHNVIKRGVDSIGKGTVWCIDKITGKDTIKDSDTVDSWVTAQPTKK